MSNKSKLSFTAWAVIMMLIVYFSASWTVTARIMTNQNMKNKFEDNGTIFCHDFFTTIPINKEGGWKLEGNRVHNDKESYHLMISCDE